MSAAAAPSPARGRLYVVLAAVLWSTSGAFTKLLREDTPLGLNSPAVSPLQMACFRALFAGLVLLPALRVRDISFRPLMLVMVVCFALMNTTFVSSMALGKAADAILLQYTAPMWMYLACVGWLGEPADRRSLITVFIGLAGIAVIITGGLFAPGDGEPAAAPALVVLALGLGSGLTYAGVLICLRVLRDQAAPWLTVQNHLFAALVLVPFVWAASAPTLAQWGVLFLFGAVQMGLPYFLMARGLRSVSPQEAGAITLLEPILNPLWAFLVAGETPSLWTLGGGAFILGALAWRYWP